MQVIIDIPEEMHKSIEQGSFGAKYTIYDLFGCVMNGIPLPAGHGRLVDADAFERRCMFYSSIEDMQDVIYALRDYKPIIEADGGDAE